MRKISVLCLLLFVYAAPAQLVSLLFKPKTITTFVNATKGSALTVVITNEKSEIDGALIKALNAYWKQGEVKYISNVEFLKKVENKSLDAKQIYLYSNYHFLAPEAQNNTALAYYLTNVPNFFVSGSYTYSSPKKNTFNLYFVNDKNSSYTNTDMLSSFFTLMIKHFNYELDKCYNHLDDVIKKTKYKESNGITFLKSETELNGKTELLSKSQVEKKVKPLTKREKRQEKRRAARKGKENKEVATYGKTKVRRMVVFDEDIDYALKKDDDNVILRNGDVLYSAKDGSVYLSAITNVKVWPLLLLSLLYTVLFFAIVVPLSIYLSEK